MSSSVTNLRRRKANGETLSEEEEEMLRAYYRRYWKTSVKVYFSPKELERVDAEMEGEGATGKSRWVKERVMRTLGMGFVSTDAFESLQREMERARQDVEAARAERDEVRAEMKQWQERFYTLQQDYQHATETLGWYMDNDSQSHGTKRRA